MKHTYNTLFIVIGLLLLESSFAATSLSDLELHEISGGEINPHLEGQSLPQEQQQPENNYSNYIPPMPLQKNDGMELAPEFFSILQSTVNVKRNREILLDGMTQQGAQALNLENVLSSDNIAANNIFNGGNLTLDDVTTEIQVNQLNSLNQLHRTQGNISSSSTGYGYEKIIESRSGSENYDYHAYSNIYQQRQSSIKYKNYDSFYAQVGAQYTSLDDFTNSLLPIIVTEQPEVGDKIFDPPPLNMTLWGTGAILDYTGIQLYGIGLQVDSINVSGNDGKDLLLGTTVTLPKLDFGTLDGQLCAFSVCGDEVTLWDLGHLGGGKIYPDFILEDLAPDVKELNLGSGISFDGDAQLITNAGNIKVSGDFYLRVTPYASLTLDFRNLVLFGVNIGDKGLLKDKHGNGVAKRTYTWEIDLIKELVPFELLDKKLEITPIEIGFVEEDHSSDEEVLYDGSEGFEVHKLTDIAESSLSEFYEHTILTGGQMTGAQAELLALSEGTLSIDNNNNVSLSGSAQQNMRVFNSVNAVTSVAANAMNISRLPTITRGSSAATQVSMQQHNRFIQQR